MAALTSNTTSMHTSPSRFEADRYGVEPFFGLPSKTTGDSAKAGQVQGIFEKFLDRQFSSGLSSVERHVFPFCQKYD
ncbi:hypothetical protein DWB63_16555 [Pseudodesulfovibrio sp. S3]|nr:hypothetical protein DWB63_16555 [Pseudodesulfovibrio sp. S3]